MTEEQKEINQNQADEDNNSIAAFSLSMRVKMKKKRDQGFARWKECSLDKLKGLLEEQLAKKDRDMVDIANYAMMVNYKTNEANNLTEIDEEEKAAVAI